MISLLLLSALAATFCAAVVAGFENGIYALSHIRLRYRLSVGDRRARVLESLLAAPERLLSSILLAQNICVYFTTAVVTAILDDLAVPWAEGLSTLALAVWFFITVEAVPKNFFRRAADTLVYPLARPLSYAFAVLRPAEIVLRAITGLVRRLGRGRGDVFNPFFTRERLAFYLREGQTEGILSEYQVELTQNILRGEKATVARAMVPIGEAAAVSVDSSVADFAALSREKRFSRYPVFSGERHNVIGVLNIYDCLRGECPNASIEELMRPAAFFAPDVHATEALRSMRETRQPMGIVADEGRAIGIVTMKDCIEEIVGELYAW